MRVFLIISILSLGFSILAKAAEDKSVYDGHTYVLVPLAKNWQMAKRDAEARGGYLVEISSSAEQRLLSNLLIKQWVAIHFQFGSGLLMRKAKVFGNGQMVSL